MFFVVNQVWLRLSRAVYLGGELDNEKNAAVQATLGGDIAALYASFRCLGEY